MSYCIGPGATQQPPARYLPRPKLQTREFWLPVGEKLNICYNQTMQKWFYIGLSLYFLLRALDIIIGTSLMVIAPWLLIPLFLTTSILGVVVSWGKTKRLTTVVYACLVVISFAFTGFSIIAVGGWSSTLRGLSALLLAPIFAVAFPYFWDDGVHKELQARLDALPNHDLKDS